MYSIRKAFRAEMLRMTSSSPSLPELAGASPRLLPPVWQRVEPPGQLRRDCTVNDARVTLT
jgi:hypothetical protein